MRFRSLAIGFGIKEVEVIHTIEAPLWYKFWLNFEMACIGPSFVEGHVPSGLCKLG
ncbi:hypothetical protein F383_13273 [Gossypium arboreum]|uniref:Uncharacterized protein n=1 Tax=Gossypium arboreum TaxID=29729 RepID=A0A0B0PYE8_GOSAR|nr:hypothetical protein F383_13273 [Gossypium arboreum]